MRKKYINNENKIKKQYPLKKILKKAPLFLAFSTNVSKLMFAILQIFIHFPLRFVSYTSNETSGPTLRCDILYLITSTVTYWWSHLLSNAGNLFVLVHI